MIASRDIVCASQPPVWKLSWVTHFLCQSWHQCSSRIAFGAHDDFIASCSCRKFLRISDAHLEASMGRIQDSGVSAKGKLCGTRACLLLSKKLDLMRGCGSSLDSLVYILTYVCGPLLVMLPPINVSNLVSQLLHPLVSLPLSFFIITAHSAAALSLFS